MTYDRMLDSDFLEEATTLGIDVLDWFNGFEDDEDINGGDAVEFISQLVHGSGLYSPKKPEPEIDIVSRIVFAKNALLVGSHDSEINMDEDRRSGLVDLLANLRHWAESEHIEYDSADLMAGEHFDAEQEEAQ